MLVSWLGVSNVTVESALALRKVPFPMLVTPAGIVMLVSEIAPLNAQVPMLVTVVGIVMLVSEIAPVKASFPMLVTPDGITTSPAHDDPSETTPSVIAKLGVELDAIPDVHR